MKIEFAPLSVPLQRILQVAAAVHWVFSFVFAGPCSIVIFIGLFFTRFWWISASYALFWALDWETPSKGGRRSQWVRTWAVWSYVKDYFPATLVKTVELDPSKNYIFSVYPHGLMGMTSVLNFGTEATGFSNTFPGLTPYITTLNIMVKIPFFRDYAMGIGLLSCDKESISYILSKPEGGNVVVIIPGGLEEGLESRRGDFTLVLKKRKGFVRAAITHGASLVPVFSFGENELYNQLRNPKGSWLRSVQERLKKVTTICLPLFYGRGIFQYTFGLLPHRWPIHTVVGKPIEVKQNLHPTKEEVDELHRIYMEELCKLFEAHKLKYRVPEDKHLSII